ncbi:MAG: hypothetical protein NZ898_04820 [Myxococcota bacterium]|nr:hypothetical protein [Myxococcota bacterium]MDW8361498.1 hypothetical protein [Myxococcales bacterium]
MKKKPLRGKLPSVRDHAPRPLGAARAGTDRPYPSATELFARADRLRDWLDQTLRGLLAPAALAGSMGLAGCSSELPARIVEWLQGEPASSSPSGNGSVSSGEPIPNGAPRNIEPPATLTPTGGPTSPPPPVLAPWLPWQPTTPQLHPPRTAGRPVSPAHRPPVPSGAIPVRPVPPPAVNPPQILGDVAFVRPVPREHPVDGEAHPVGTAALQRKR